jgi:hypothetical protein
VSLEQSLVVAIGPLFLCASDFAKERYGTPSRVVGLGGMGFVSSATCVHPGYEFT